MNANDSRYDRSNVPDSSWPDGTPVSNWSHAVAAFACAGAQARPPHEDARSESNRMNGRL